MFCRDVGFSGKLHDVVDHALDMLRDVIEVKQNNTEKFIKPCLTTPEVIDLLHYSNLVSIDIKYYQ